MRQELLDFFSDLLTRHVRRLVQRGEKLTGLCPFHAEQTPSFTAHLGKGVYYCFGCGAGGGVAAFATAVGEPLPWRRRDSPLPDLVVLRRRLHHAATQEFRAWKAEKRLDAVADFAAAEAALRSLAACFRFAFPPADQARLHRLMDEQGAALLDAIDRFDRYDLNPLLDDAAAQREWVDERTALERR
jgi:hypothetical protein